LFDLTAGLGYAVRVEDAGRIASEYHTTQVPPSRAKRRFATRARELSVPKSELKTILSRREYRSDALATVCLL
jgi:CRISPR system Cascade subunit CasD